MSEPATPDELATATQLAEMMGVVPSAVSNYLKRNVRFPEPWGTWGSVRLWRVADVLAWRDDRQADQRAARQRRTEHLRAQLARLEES